MVACLRQCQPNCLLSVHSGQNFLPITYLSWKKASDPFPFSFVTSVDKSVLLVNCNLSCTSYDPIDRHLGKTIASLAEEAGQDIKVLSLMPNFFKLL